MSNTVKRSNGQHPCVPSGEVQSQLLEAGALDRLLRLVHPDEAPAPLVLTLDTLRTLGDSDDHRRVWPHW